MTLPPRVRRAVRCLAAACLFVPLSGCLVVSLQPIYDDTSVEFTETILGTWEQQDDTGSLTVERGAWNAYDLAFRDSDETTRFTGHLTRIAGKLVLDATVATGVEKTPGTVQTHWPFLVDLKGDTLVLRALDYDWFKARLGQRALAPLAAAMDGEKNVVMAASTGNVRAWIASHMAYAGVWDEGGTFTRKAPAAAAAPAPHRETEPVVEAHEGDDYTRYELLAPETASFRITYEVTATQAGARYYFNVIRKGSEASDEAVFDQASGAALPFTVVTGAQARATGLASADPDAQYIQVALAKPVPEGGETRLRIEKTYKDAASYFREGPLIVFSRSLGIRRNAVVLPAGYELVACNVPSQVAPERDGRTRVSFMNLGPAAAPLVIKALPLPAPDGKAATPSGPAASRETAAAAAAAQAPGPSITARLAERAHQDREIVYFLQQPGTHAFALYHDYTERRPGIDKYLNVVRAGSRVSNPSARLLDTGEALKVETLEGEAVTKAKLDIGEPVRPDTEVVVISFPAVTQGRSARLRIQETYTDPGRYYLDGDEFVWDRSLGRAQNAVVLPAGWYLTAKSIPAVVTTMPDGRIRLEYNNPRPDEVAVLLKGRRR